MDDCVAPMFPIRLIQCNKIVHARFEVFTAVTMKDGVFLDVMPCGSFKNDVSEELSSSFIRVTRIGELGTTLAVTSNRHSVRLLLSVCLEA
jgi:hypothetical protein